MQAWKLLFSSDIGLLTVAVFIVMFAMIGYFIWLFGFKRTADKHDGAPLATRGQHA